MVGPVDWAVILLSLVGRTLLARVVEPSPWYPQELSETFTIRYLCFVKQKQSVTNMFRAKVERGESLRDFMKRFGWIIHQLDTMSMDSVMQPIKQVVKSNSQFSSSISLKPPTLIDELFQRASKYSSYEKMTLLQGLDRQWLLMKAPLKALGLSLSIGE